MEPNERLIAKKEELVATEGDMEVEMIKEEQPSKDLEAEVVK